MTLKSMERLCGKHTFAILFCWWLTLKRCHPGKTNERWPWSFHPGNIHRCTWIIRTHFLYSEQRTKEIGVRKAMVLQLRNLCWNITRNCHPCFSIIADCLSSDLLYCRTLVTELLLQNKLLVYLVLCRSYYRSGDSLNNNKLQNTKGSQCKSCKIA